jgi:hypothetical protein
VHAGHTRHTPHVYKHPAQELPHALKSCKVLQGLHASPQRSSKPSLLSSLNTSCRSLTLYSWPCAQLPGGDTTSPALNLQQEPWHSPRTPQTQPGYCCCGCCSLSPQPPWVLLARSPAADTCRNLSLPSPEMACWLAEELWQSQNDVKDAMQQANQQQGTGVGTHLSCCFWCDCRGPDSIGHHVRTPWLLHHGVCSNAKLMPTSCLTRRSRREMCLLLQRAPNATVSHQPCCPLHGCQVNAEHFLLS